MANDPLKDLLLDADEVDRANLAQALKQYIGIDSKAGRIVLKPDFNALDARRKVLGVAGDEGCTPAGQGRGRGDCAEGLVTQTGMPKGTVNPKLSELRDARLISRAVSGELDPLRALPSPRCARTWRWPAQAPLTLLHVQPVHGTRPEGEVRWHAKQID